MVAADPMTALQAPCLDLSCRRRRRRCRRRRSVAARRLRPTAHTRFALPPSLPRAGPRATASTPAAGGSPAARRPAAAMVQQHAVICGGAGATMTLEQVAAVASGAQVALDSAALGRLKKESPAPKAFQPGEPPAAAPSDGSGAALERPQARAALFYKLLALVNGRSGVRPAVAEALAALLNAGGAPRLPAADADAPALAALAAVLQGVGAAEAADGRQLSAAEALATAGVEAPGLSAAERAVLADGQSAAAGTAALCVQAGKLLLASANAVAALAAEALQADVSAPAHMLHKSNAHAALPGGRAAAAAAAAAAAPPPVLPALRSGPSPLALPPRLAPTGEGFRCRGGGGMPPQGRH